MGGLVTSYNINLRASFKEDPTCRKSEIEISVGMTDCVGGVYGIIKITSQRPSNVRAGWVHAKAVKTVYEIPEQLKILRKLNLIEDLEKTCLYVFAFFCSVFRMYHRMCFWIAPYGFQ